MLVQNFLYPRHRVTRSTLSLRSSHPLWGPLATETVPAGLTRKCK